jgi:hypothetical protein
MTAAEEALVLDEVQAKLAGAQLLAEWYLGIDSRDLDRAMATWHPHGVLSFTAGPVMDGTTAIEAFLKKNWAAYSEIYHWCSSPSLTVHGDGTMHGQCRIAALCVRRSGTAIRETGISVADYTKTQGAWLLCRQAVTIQHRDPAA